MGNSAAGVAVGRVLDDLILGGAVGCQVLRVLLSRVELDLLLLRRDIGAQFIVAAAGPPLRSGIDVGVCRGGRHTVVLGGRFSERELNAARPWVQDGEGAGGGGAEDGDQQGGRRNPLYKS